MKAKTLTAATQVEEGAFEDVAVEEVLRCPCKVVSSRGAHLTTMFASRHIGPVERVADRPTHVPSLSFSARRPGPPLWRNAFASTFLCDDSSESMSDRTLKQIVERQKSILASAAKQGDKVDQESLRVQLQSICHEYELLLANSPDFAAAYVSYALLLGKVDMRREAMAMLLKANKLDQDIPLVKNQLGNYLAEDGKPLEAVNYFILRRSNSSRRSHLYHYELGKLLFDARDDFLKSGSYTRAELDRTMFEAFKKAAELGSPDQIAYTYRYAESFGDVEKPDWDAALKAWADLEDKAQSQIERETMRLQAANILIKQGRFDHARVLLATISVPALDSQETKADCASDRKVRRNRRFNHACPFLDKLERTFGRFSLPGLSRSISS